MVKALTLAVVLMASVASAQDCVHPHLVRNAAGDVWIECVETSVTVDRLHHIGQILFSAANTADVATTIYGLNRGYHEANPLLSGITQHPAWFGAMKGAETVAVLTVSERYYYDHPKLVTALEWAAAGWYGAVAAHNARLK